MIYHWFRALGPRTIWIIYQHLFFKLKNSKGRGVDQRNINANLWPKYKKSSWDNYQTTALWYSEASLMRMADDAALTFSVYYKWGEQQGTKDSYLNHWAFELKCDDLSNGYLETCLMTIPTSQWSALQVEDGSQYIIARPCPTPVSNLDVPRADASGSSCTL